MFINIRMGLMVIEGWSLSILLNCKNDSLLEVICKTPYILNNSGNYSNINKQMVILSSHQISSHHRTIYLLRVLSVHVIDTPHTRYNKILRTSMRASVEKHSRTN